MSNQISRSIIVDAPAAHVYSIWSDFTQFPHFMSHVKSVEKRGDGVTHWVVSGPMGADIDWNAEVTRAEPDKRIAWNTKDRDGDLTTSGQVTFNPLSGSETEITVTMQYSAPGGKVGDWVASVLANPEESVTEDLRRFKEYAEGREVTELKSTI